jgi:hypothetical protein
MLRDLENLPGIAQHPLVLAPAALLFAVVSLFHFLVSTDGCHV